MKANLHKIAMRVKAGFAVAFLLVIVAGEAKADVFSFPRPTISLDSDLRNYNAGGSGYVQRNEGGIRNREGSP